RSALRRHADAHGGRRREPPLHHADPAAPDRRRGELARAAGAVGAESNVLFLRPGTRETFFEFLAIDFPRLVPEYSRLYAGSAYVPSGRAREIDERVRRLAAAVGLATRRRADRPDQRAPRQLNLSW